MNASSTASCSPIAAQASAARSGAIHANLSLAVVAEGGGLQHCRTAEIRDARDASLPSDRTSRYGVVGNPALVRNAFSRIRCCVVCKYRSAGPDGRATGRCLGRRRRNIFELERYYADVPGEIGNRIQIVVGRHHFHVGHLPGGRVLIRRERVDAITHAPRGNREHPPQLPASQHADRSAGQYRLLHARSFITQVLPPGL